jgi:ActR/RegA family two-component response regulator
MRTDRAEEPKRILVVDEEETVAAFLRLLLVERGFAVEIAASAHEALASVESGRFDLVLVDRGLADTSPVEFVASVRERVATSRVVILASVGSGKTALELLRAGAADYLLRADGDVESFVRRMFELVAAPPHDGEDYAGVDPEALPADFRAAMKVLRERRMGLLASVG